MSLEVGRLLMGPEGAFLAPLLGRPDDEDARERYRAWLAERGDERAELFDIERELSREDRGGRERAIARAKEILAKSRAVREWWTVVARAGPVRNCGTGPAGDRRVRFAYECPRTWDTLAPTDDGDARHCDACERLVYLCRTREEAEARARSGDCITLVSASFDRLRMELTSGYTGRPEPVAIWAERVFPSDGGEE